MTGVEDCPDDELHCVTTSKLHMITIANNRMIKKMLPLLFIVQCFQLPDQLNAF